MKLVVIESPFAGDVERNLAYVRACMADCLRRGEAPYASHALYTQPGVLDDTIPEERTLGIEAGIAWNDANPYIVRCFYVDRGWSRGMVAALKRHLSPMIPKRIRRLGAPWSDSPAGDAEPGAFAVLQALAEHSATGVFPAHDF